MRQYCALLRGQGTSIVGLYWAGCIIICTDLICDTHRRHEAEPESQ
jgi:hypothetical protein